MGETDLDPAAQNDATKDAAADAKPKLLIRLWHGLIILCRPPVENGLPPGSIVLAGLLAVTGGLLAYYSHERPGRILSGICLALSFLLAISLLHRFFGADSFTPYAIGLALLAAAFRLFVAIQTVSLEPCRPTLARWAEIGLAIAGGALLFYGLASSNSGPVAAEAGANLAPITKLFEQREGTVTVAV